MNAPILDLIAACGVPIPRDDSAWRKVLLMHNLGAIPGGELEGDHVGNRGFNVLIVDDAGMPAYFCKWRPTRPGSSPRVSLAERLSRVPELASVLPKTWSIRTNDVDGEVTRYVTGVLLDVRLRSMKPIDLHAALVDILHAAGRVSAGAMRLEPSLLAGSPNIRLRDAGGWTLSALAEAGLANETLSVVERALERAGWVPRVPQHGDLWPRNVLDAGGRWLILDLEFYGRIQVPLYDAFHLVRTSWDARPRWRAAGPAWTDELRAPGPEGVAYKKILINAVRTSGLSRTQAGGALVYYIVDIAARLHRRRIPSDDVMPYLLEVRRMADWLAAGRRADELLTLH